jgi:hypothetical protein
MSNSTTDEDTQTLIFVGAALLMLGVPVASFLAPVREWMVAHGILVTGEEVLLPIADGAGLDIWRIAILAGVAIGAVLLIVLAVRSRRRKVRGRV